MSSLEFQINLRGDFAQNLGKANEKLEKTSEHAKHAAHDVELFEGEVGKLSGGLLGLEVNLQALSKGGSLFTFDLAEGLREAYEVVEKIVDGIIDVGKEIVHVAGQTQDINLAVRLNVGDEGAEKIDELAETFKDKTRFSASQIKTALLPLLQQGLGKNVEQLGDLTAAATDYAARTNSGIAGVQTALESFGNIALRGQVNFRLLKQLKISEADFNNELGSLLHTDSKAAEKLMKEGKVGKDDLLTTALNLLAKQQGGVLGNASQDSAKTLGGTLERLSHVKENLFEGIAESPGMKAVQGFLDNLIETLEGKAGTELVAKISSLFETLFGDLSGPDGMQKVEDKVEAIAKRAGEFIDDFKGAWPDIKAGAEGVFSVIEGIGKTVAMIVDGWRQIFQLAKEVYEIGGGVQKPAISHGNAGYAAYEAERQRNVDLAHANVSAVAGDLEIPKMAAGGVVTQPTLAIIGEAGPEAIVPLDGDLRRQMNETAFGGAADASSSGRSIVIGDIIFQLAGGQPSDQMQEAARQFRAELKRFLDEVPA